MQLGSALSKYISAEISIGHFADPFPPLKSMLADLESSPRA